MKLHQSPSKFAVNVLGTRKQCMVGSGIGNCNTSVGQSGDIDRER